MTAANALRLENARPPFDRAPARPAAQAQLALTSRTPEPEDDNRLIGRSDVLAQIEEFILDPEPRARVLVLHGERGIGKTATLRAAIELARAHQLPVVAHAARGRKRSLALAALRTLFEHTPALLAVDDVRALDQTSARWIETMLVDRAAHEGVRMIVTDLASDPSLPLVRQLPPAAVTELKLEPLDAATLDALVYERAWILPADERHRIVSGVAGNPRVALELARVAGAEGPSDTSILPSVSATLRAMVEAGPAFTSSSARPSLEALAVLGEADIATLEALEPEAKLPESSIVANDGGVLRFADPLLRLAVYESTALQRRQLLHQRCAELVDDAIERLLHRAAAGEQVADELEDALDGQPTSLTARLARLSLMLTPEDQPEPAVRRRVKLAMALVGGGTPAAARAVLDAAIEDVRPGAWSAAALVQRAHLGDLSRDQRAWVLGEALRRSGDDPATHAMVLESLALEIGLRRGDLVSAAGSASVALTLARDVADETRLGSASAAARWIGLLRGERRAVPAACPHVAALEKLWSGESAEACRAFSTLADNGPLDRARLLGVLAEAELRLGLWAEATSHATSAARTARRSDDRTLFRSVRAILRLLAAHRGSTEDEPEWLSGPVDADDYLAEENAEARVRELWAAGLRELAQGRPRTAAVPLADAMQRLGVMGVGNPGAYPLGPDAVEALAAADRLEEAEEFTRLFEKQAGVVGTPLASLVALRCGALVTLARGQAAEAASMLEEAHAGLVELGHRFDAARTMLSVGRAWRRAGQRARAVEALAAAEAGFEAVGADQWRERAHDERLRVGRRRSDDRNELTDAELQVAELVAAGHTNREVAAHLCTGVATIESHLTRIYRKLDVRSRTQLTRLLMSEASAG